MATYFRGDQFVKSPLGPAVAGAQVYVCTQPASVPQAPAPSPLAALYADSGGISPLTQPLTTDGFGHAWFYAAAGIYTIAIYLNGILQLKLPDQLIGSNGVGSISLQTGGVPNFDQAIENLIAGLNISLTPDTLGGTTISSVLPLKTDGVLNADQTEENLLSGTNIHLVNSGAGTTINTSFGLVQTKRLVYTVQAADVTNGYVAIPVTWATPFIDANYTVVFSVFGPGSGELNLFPASMQNVVASGLKIFVWGFNTAVNLGSSITLEVIGIHD